MLQAPFESACSWTIVESANTSYLNLHTISLTYYYQHKLNKIICVFCNMFLYLPVGGLDSAGAGSVALLSAGLSTTSASASLATSPSASKIMT